MVSSGGAQLFVRERGRARAPVVLLVHGYPDTHSVWDELAEQLAERFRVVAYDTRGMGRSTAPAETRAFALAQLARDLEAVIESIPGDEWVHLVGHDWGAFAAWEAVSAPAPDPRIASLTAVAGPRIDLAPMWVRSRLRPSPVALGQLFSQARRSWYIAAFQLPVLPERIVATAFERSWPAVMRRLERIQPRAGHPAPTLVHDARTGLALYRANFATFAGRRRRARPQLPVQLVVATRDRYVSPALYAEAASWGRDVWRRDVRAGHWVQRSHPALLARYVTDLIEHAEGEGDSRPLRRARLSEHSARGALAGRLAVVTGAGSGIGRATALALVAQGAEVIAVDIDGQAAGETAVLAGGDEVARAAEVDVADAAAMERFAGLVAERDGVPQIVVNNAGIGVAGPFLEMAVADWERIVDVNLWGVIHGARLFARQMVDAGVEGQIVNVASAAAYTPSRMLSAYATTKAAVLMLSECLRAELADHGIGVTAICPGVVDTNIVRTVQIVGVSEQEQARLRERSTKAFGLRGYSADRVADSIVRAVRQNAAVVPVTPEAALLLRMSQLTPSLLRRLARIDPRTTRLARGA